MAYRETGVVILYIEIYITRNPEGGILSSTATVVASLGLPPGVRVVLAAGVGSEQDVVIYYTRPRQAPGLFELSTISTCDAFLMVLLLDLQYDESAWREISVCSTAP